MTRQSSNTSICGLIPRLGGRGQVAPETYVLANRGCRFLLIALAGSSAPAVAALAQSQTPAEIRSTPSEEVGASAAASYSAAEFSRFSPRTTPDMLQKVPGFTIQREADSRGLGGARGNVVVNGRRITGKSNDVLTELRKIPAANVVRIEVVDASSIAPMRRSLHAISLATLATALAAPAFAQQVEAQVPAPAPVPGATSRTTSYDAAFFTAAAPRSALDIARRVPGFALDLGNTDTRGFAGAAGNVVINGARPSTKSETLDTTLARIPARRVVRVEVGPGDLYGAEYASKSQVLNVILSAESGIDGNVTAVGRRLYTGYVNTDLSGSALIKRGASSINLSAGTGRNRQLDEGTDTLVDLDTGEEFEFRRKVSSYFSRNPYLSGSWGVERASDNSMRFNARWAPSRFDLTQYNRVSTTGGPDRDDNLIQTYRNPVIELGGDITRPLRGGAIKLVALATRRKRDNFDTYIGRDGLIEDAAAVVGGFEQLQDARQGETIARLNWTRSNLAGFTFEAGVEGVLNTLDSEVDFFAIDEDGERVRIDLPIDRAKVKEKRAEAYISVGRNLTPKLRIDGGLNYEISRLRVTGDAEAERSLQFLKPNIAIDWKPGDGWHTRLSLRRTVAQLNFYDFISVAELSNDRVNGGNAELLPQRTWEVRATIEKPILGDGLFKVDLGLDRIAMLQDQILTEEGFSAPGNLGTGKRRFVSFNIDAPLQRFGLTGTRLKINGQLQRTRVLDPISDAIRNFSDFYPDWQWGVQLRRDAGAFSYGFSVNDRDRFSFFRANEIDSNWYDGPYGTVFVEYRPAGNTSVTLDIDNLFNTGSYRERVFFLSNRSAPDPAARELRERNRHVSFGLTLKQSFGASSGGGVAQAR